MRSTGYSVLTALLLSSTVAADECGLYVLPAEVKLIAGQAGGSLEPHRDVHKDYLLEWYRHDDGPIIFVHSTLETHPAHPSVIVTNVYEANGETRAFSKSATAGDCNALVIWREEILRTHDELKSRHAAQSPN